MGEHVCIKCRKQLAEGEGLEQVQYGRGSRWNRPTVWQCRPCLDQAERDRDAEFEELERSVRRRP